MNTNELQSVVGKFTVLYVEDDLDVATKSKRLFEELFIQVDHANDGIEALKCYNSYYQEHNKNYDIVISDISMPNKDGIELSKDLLQINSKQPIVIISAHNESDVLQKLINIGVKNFIHKPIKLNELIQVTVDIGQDIQQDEKSQNEMDEVQKLNEEFESLFRGYNDIIITSRTNVNGLITYVSKGFEKISGYKESELLGKSHSVIRHPDMPNNLFSQLWKTIKDGKVWKSKLKNLKRNGDYYWTNISIAPYFDKEGSVIGYNSITEDITYQVKLEELHKKMDTIMSNTNDGYLLINNEIKIQGGYSKKCLEIFKKEKIENLSLHELLFEHDTKNKNLLVKGLTKLNKCDDEEKKKLFLSLLPKEATLNNQSFEISYKIIDINIMIIMKDITKKIMLEKKLLLEEKEHRMIINVITNLDDFIELKNDFEIFLGLIYNNDNTLKSNFQRDEKTQKILRSFHTFKGLFHQMQMCYTTDVIHNLEEYITKKVNNDEISSININIDVAESFKKDIQIIKDILGEDYILEHNTNKQNKNILKKIKYQIRSLVNEPVNVNFQLQKIVSQIDILSYINVETVINKHMGLVQYLGNVMGKELYPLIIQKEKNLKVPPTFRNFFRNLVHVYKNSVDHGIEDEEIRLVLGKDTKGQLRCKYYYLQNNFHLIISDDGQGIDIEKTVNKAVDKSLITLDELKNMDEKQKLELVFLDHLSTKDIANDISGRGVGMSSLKQSCEEIGGTINLINHPKKGLKYHFTIPMEKILDNLESDEYLQELITLLEAVSNQMKLFFKNKLNIDIINVRFVENADTTNKINTLIELDNGKENLKFYFSYTYKIVEQYASTCFKDIYDPEELEESLDDYSNEMINTFAGLAIQDFPQKYVNGLLGIPKTVDSETINNEKEKTITNQIQTNYGNMICKLVHESRS